jgi:hypothetical protein
MALKHTFNIMEVKLLRLCYHDIQFVLLIFFRWTMLGMGEKRSSVYVCMLDAAVEQLQVPVLLQTC